MQSESVSHAKVQSESVSYAKMQSETVLHAKMQSEPLVSHAKSPSSEMLQSMLELDEEYITQFLEFTPKTLIDGLYNVIFEYGKSGLDALQTVLLKENRGYVEQSELSKGRDAILEKLVNITSRTFDKLEKYLNREVFKMPENFVFPEDEVQLKLDISDQNNDDLDKEIAKLTQKIIHTKAETAYLVQESKELHIVLDEYMKMHSLLQNFEKRAKQNEISGIKEIEEVYEGLQKMSNILFEHQILSEKKQSI